MIYHGHIGFEDLADTVDRTVRALRPRIKDFDSIIVTGVSGAAVGFPVALCLDKPILVLRKDNEDSHCMPGELMNKHHAGKRVLFLDDFMSTGRTRERCSAAIAKQTKARVVAQYMYAQNELHWGKLPRALAEWDAAGEEMLF